MMPTTIRICRHSLSPTRSPDSALGDRTGIASSLRNVGFMHFCLGNFAAARTIGDEGLAIGRELDCPHIRASWLHGLADIAFAEGDDETVRRLMEEELELRRSIGYKRGIANTLGVLGWVAHRQRHWEDALTCLQESLEIWRDLDERPCIAFVLEGLARVAASHGRRDLAARLFGAVDGLNAWRAFEQIIQRTDLDHTRAALCAAMGRATFVAAWAAGHALPLEQVIVEALELALIPEWPVAGEDSVVM
jgi:ATP/maltotriose-dependent transcriptional regulator MalT